MDTAIYVAQALGVPKENITWKEATGDQRQQLLENGQADLIFSTFSITDERKKVVDFAGPYFVAHQDLLVRRNDTEITGPEALDGKNLCSVPGTTSAAYVTSHYLGTIHLVELPRFSDCVTALADSEVDAVTTDDVILAGFAAEPQYQGKLKVVGKGFSDELYGVGVKKGDTALVDEGQRRVQAVHRRRFVEQVARLQRAPVGLLAFPIHPRPQLPDEPRCPVPPRTTPPSTLPRPRVLGRVLADTRPFDAVAPSVRDDMVRSARIERFGPGELILDAFTHVGVEVFVVWRGGSTCGTTPTASVTSPTSTSARAGSSGSPPC